MEKEIRLILNELRKIENTEGPDKITRKKLMKFAKYYDFMENPPFYFPVIVIYFTSAKYILLYFCILN